MKPKFPFITLTGIDEATDVLKVSELDAEIAILYSAKGFDAGGFRYPSRHWIGQAAQILPRAAVHICGGLARAQLLGGELLDITHHVQRIQVNGFVEEEELDQLVSLYPTHTIIVQYTKGNHHLLNLDIDHAFLVDGSGGRGLLPVGWNRPITEKLVGFAGGLGPDNLEIQLPLISAAAGNYPWTVDMENKLRVDDRFSIPLATKAVEAFHSFLHASV